MFLPDAEGSRRFSLACFPSVSALHQPARSEVAFFYADSAASVTTVDRQ